MGAGAVDRGFPQTGCHIRNQRSGTGHLSVVWCYAEIPDSPAQWQCQVSASKSSPSWLGWGWCDGATLTAAQKEAVLWLLSSTNPLSSVLSTRDQAWFSWCWDCLWVAGCYLVFHVPSNLPSHSYQTYLPQTQIGCIPLWKL